MSLLDAVLSREIAEIEKQSQKDTHKDFKLIIKANGQEYRALYVIQKRTDKLFAQNYADEITLSAGFITSDAQFGIIPHKDLLEAVIITIPYVEGVDGDNNAGSDQVKKLYKAQLIDGGKSMSVEGDSPFAVNKGLATRQDITEIRIQLFDSSIDWARKQNFGTVFRETSIVAMLRYILGEKCQGSKGVTIMEGIMDKTPDHVVVNHPTPLLDVPRALNVTIGGYYPTGFGYYFFHDYWHVYPLFNSELFGKTPHSLTIIKVPRNKIARLQRTYRITPTQTIILVTRETRHTDFSEQMALNDGNGVRYTDASRVMEKDYALAKGNKAIVGTVQNIHEVVSTERKDGKEMVSTGRSKITDKYNLEYSEMARRDGALLQVIWESSSADHLPPGCPVRYIFADGDTVKELYGTLNAVETMDYQDRVDIGNPRFKEQSLLTVFVKTENPIASKVSKVNSSSLR